MQARWAPLRTDVEYGCRLACEYEHTRMRDITLHKGPSSCDLAHARASEVRLKYRHRSHACACKASKP